MIPIKNNNEIKKMRQVGKLSANLLKYIEDIENLNYFINVDFFFISKARSKYETNNYNLSLYISLYANK